MDWNFLIRNNDSLCVTTDSRNITSGCVFVALKGEHFNGNAFAAQAIEKGAAYAVVDEDIPVTCSQKCEYNGRIIRVESSLAALQDLARAWHRHLQTPVIAITGTNGKTTTKELLAAVLAKRYNLLYTQGNYNNSLGVPLTLLRLTREHELAVVEMGASHPGDIKELVDIAEPAYGLITNVGRAHLQGFGSFEGVMRTKAELYDYIIAHSGTVFINEDNNNLKTMLRNAMASLGGEQKPKVVTYHTGTMPEGMHLVGNYNAENVSAALCVGKYFCVSDEAAHKAVLDYVPSNNRSQAVRTDRNSLIVDAYNANPTSMQAAINAFKGDTYILGAMRELGKYTHLEHQNIVNMLAERKADKVILIGSEWRETTAPYDIYDSIDDLKETGLLGSLNGRHILIKGSNSVHLDKIIDLL